MGILDDLAMGFGMKERTEDYDARTARTIAANEAAARRGDATDATFLAQARNPSHFSYIGDDYGSSGGARMFLNRVGGTGYNPRRADDNRPFMQRMMTSPTGTASPTRYAIGPMELDQPLPAFGLLGLFTKGLSNMFQGGDDTDASINVGKRAMGMLPRTSTMNTPPTSLIGNGQPETGEEDFSGVDIYDPATDYIEPDFSQTIPATTAGQEFAENQDFLDTVQSAIDMAGEGETPPLSNSNFYDPTGAFGMRTGTSAIRRMPNGRFVDITTGRILF